MPLPETPLSTILPPIIVGTAVFNTQYNDDPHTLPIPALISRALALQMNAFDTSPYYGPSEVLLGDALSSISPPVPRESYFLLTKVGRIGPSEFDYTPGWIRKSIARSLERLHTNYLDVVYCHDIEFVSLKEVLIAVKELRRIRDEEGSVKWIGVCGYPLGRLCEAAELILKETGEPLDIVQSYANFTLQNSTLAQRGINRLHCAGVSVVPNASILGMGLLRGVGVPGDWHPAPKELIATIQEVAKFLEANGEKLEPVAIRWALDMWARVGGSPQGGWGVSVIGVSNMTELEETYRVWKEVHDGLEYSEKFRKELVSGARKHATHFQLPTKCRESLERKIQVEKLAQCVWKMLGEWKNFAWQSPEAGFVNTRVYEKEEA